MTKKIRMRATLTYEYDADPKNYPGCSTPEQMAELDSNEGMVDVVRDEGCLKVEVVA